MIYHEGKVERSSRHQCSPGPFRRGSGGRRSESRMALRECGAGWATAAGRGTLANTRLPGNRRSDPAHTQARPPPVDQVQRGHRVGGEAAPTWPCRLLVRTSDPSGPLAITHRGDDPSLGVGCGRSLETQWPAERGERRPPTALNTIATASSPPERRLASIHLIHPPCSDSIRMSPSIAESLQRGTIPEGLAARVRDRRHAPVREPPPSRTRPASRRPLPPRPSPGPPPPVLASGFSHSKCLPAASAASATSA
jgi:hypothetical protein